MPQVQRPPIYFGGSVDVLVAVTARRRCPTQGENSHEKIVLSIVRQLVVDTKYYPLLIHDELRHIPGII